MRNTSTMGRKVLSFVFGLLSLLLALPAAAALTVTPLTWNIIGLDSNTPATGPEFFPVGARVCSTTAATNVTVDYVWDSANAFVSLRPGSLSSIVFPTIAAGSCVDAYFEVAVTRTAAAFDTTRRYRITATEGAVTVSTPSPRELYVEHLVSQARNAVTNVSFGPAGGPLTAVPPGGAMNLVVGNQYDIRLDGGTATGGYEQFAAFINFSNAIFRIVDVDTTYAVVAPPRVVSPNDRLYADACLWENDPDSPNYRTCLSTGKAGGAPISTTYRILIVAGGGSSETLNTLLYDFSGSSFHYNADYGVGARIANLIDPASADIAKEFVPATTNVGGVSKLRITLSNPNAGPLSGYSFTDNLPAGMTIASPHGLATSGCGTPTFTPLVASGGTSIGFSNGTVAANSSCVISLNVTTASNGSFVNTTSHLFVGAVDTGNDATATLTVDNAPPPPAPICGLPMATWNFLTGSSATNPAPTTASVAASANAGAGFTPSIQTDNVAGASGSWASDNINTGALNTANNEYFEFVLNTTGFSSVDVSFQGKRTAQGPTTATLFSGLTGSTAGPAFTLTTAFQAFGPATISSGLNPSGNTLFRIYLSNASQNNNGHFGFLDGVTFTGCATPQHPTLAKAFAPTAIGLGPAGTSTLTFTLTNPNASALTGAAFTDALPTGLQVAATPAASNTCGATFAPAAGATTLTVSGGTIPASGSCTVQVAVTATTAGPKANISGPLSTTQTGTNTGPAGTASATLDVLAAPTIEKNFGPNPILTNGVSTLTFVITNPNPDAPISGVAFGDTFPVAPGAMLVAATPNASTTGCGAPTFAPAAGAGSIAFSGGSIAAGGSCTVRVDVTAAAAGNHVNTSGSVTHLVGATAFGSDNASDTLTVNPPNPSVTLLKQVGATATGPWLSYLALPVGANVFYRLTVENTGDVPINPLQVSDPTFPNLNTLCSFPASLPVAVAANDNHIATCIFDTATPIAAVSGEHVNTATARDTDPVPPVTDSDSATYATTGLTLAKSANPTTFTAAGETITYSFLVTNSGAATLSGPVTISDPLVTATCPALTTIGDLDAFFDPGEAVTCNGTYVTTPADVSNGSIANTATASAGGATSPPSSVTITTPQSADLSVSKTLVTAGPYAPGGTVVFNITVSNSGPNAASNVSLTDTDSNLTVTNVASGTMTCAGAAFPCTLASLANGASATVTVTATVDAVGAFSNSATVSSATPDPVPGNDSGTDGDIATSADLVVTKTLDTAGPYAAGGTVNFTITVTNNGPSAASNVSVSDVDANLTVTSAVGTGLSCAGSAFPCSAASLASGASATIAVTATIDANGAFSNSATATSDTPDPVPGNNTGTDGDTATSADLVVTKMLDTAGPYAAGDTVSFTITVTNNGPSAASNVSVSDVDTNLTVTSAVGTGLSCAGSAFPCTAASLASGASATIAVTATIDANGAFSNSATASSDTPDPVPGNNTGSDGDGATSADLAVTKVLDTAGPYAPGSSVSFTVTVTNNGPDSANNLSLTDTDTNLTVTSVSSGTMTCAGAAFPCTLASLANGASATVTVTATVDAVGAFDNTAAVTSATPDPVPGNNSSTDGDTATSADLAVTKVLDTAGPYTAGTPVAFTVTVTNNGPSAASNVVVSDVDTNLTVTGVSSGTMTCAGNSFPCTLATLASGASATITVNATVDTNGAFSNSATATSTTPDPVPGNNTGSDGDGATSADLAVTKVLDTAGPYAPGSSVVFTVTVTNNGPDAANNVSLTDVDTNLTVTNVNSGTMTCAGSTFPCTLASLASGASATATVTATVDAVGAFSNTATASSATPDPVPGNNTGTDGDTAVSADLAVSKSLDTAGPYSAGGNVVFTVTVTNNGPSAANSVSLIDTDTNLTVTNVSSGTMTCAGSTFPCTLASLASGASATVTVTATIDAVGAFDNTATVSSATPDPVPGNNSGTDGDVVGPSADVAVLKTLTTAGPYAVGQTVSFSILVSNAGPSTATNVQVTDTPTNLAITSVTGAGCAALPCTIASLASGANATITVTATILADGSFGNSATATSATPDPDPSDNTDDDTGSTTPSADLSIVKSIDNPIPTVGGTVTFMLAIANGGPSAAAGVQVVDVLPAGYTFVGSSASVGSYNSGTGVWTVGALANGGSATLTLQATVNAAGPYANTGVVSASTPDPDPSDNSSTATPTPVQGGPGEADLAIVKTASTLTPTIGGPLTFTLALQNTGPDDASGVLVTDLLPAGYSFVAASASVGSYDAATGVWTVGSLANGASATLQLTVTVAPTGPYANTATVSSSSSDPDPSDNVSTSTPTPVSAGPGSADLSVLKTGPAQITRGQQLTFNIQVRNVGPDDAINARLLDPTPAGLVFVATAGACTAGFPCTLGNMANGEVRTLTATYFVPADYAGPNMIVNTVTAVSDSADPTPGDSSSSSSVLVPQGVPNLAAPQVVPVDARWALLLLAGLMLLVARRGFLTR